MLYSTNISLSVWFLGGIATLGLIACGIIFFRCCERISAMWPLYFSFHNSLRPISATFLLFLAGDIASYQFFPRGAYQKLAVTLPWKTTLYYPDFPSLDRHLFFQPAPSEEELIVRVGAINQKNRKNPDIFIFVVESLREDFLDDKTAPNLSQFSKENIKFHQGISNSNATQTSWFSLFYSQLPFYWSKYRPSQWSRGSIALQALKRLGYSIHVVSSARLNYYQMDEMIFGKNDSFSFLKHLIKGWAKLFINKF